MCEEEPPPHERDRERERERKRRSNRRREPDPPPLVTREVGRVVTTRTSHAAGRIDRGSGTRADLEANAGVTETDFPIEGVSPPPSSGREAQPAEAPSSDSECGSSHRPSGRREVGERESVYRAQGLAPGRVEQGHSTSSLAYLPVEPTVGSGLARAPPVEVAEAAAAQARGQIRAYVGDVDINAEAADYEEGDTCEDRQIGFTYSTLFSGGIDSAHHAWTPLQCKCVAACELSSEARQLILERSGIRAATDFNRLRQRDARRFRCEVLISGAPCVAFSRAGSRRGTGDARGRLYYRQLDVIEWMAAADRPLVVVLEQVTEVLVVENGKAQADVLRRLKSLGYTPVTYILNSHDYGSASQRVRLFTIGVRNDVHRAVGTINRPREATLTIRRRRVSDVTIPLVLRPRTHIVRRASLRLVPSTDSEPQGDVDYTGPKLLYRTVGLGYQWRVYSHMGAGVTQRATGTNPTGLYEQDGAIVRLTARESARLQDIDDSVDIGLRWGEDAAQYFVGNAISVFTLRALGLEIKRLLAAWRTCKAPASSPESTHSCVDGVDCVDGGETDDGDVDIVKCDVDGVGNIATTNTGDHVDNNKGSGNSDADDGFYGRHVDGCPVWCKCTPGSCPVCERFPWPAARKFTHLCWLRLQRRKWRTLRLEGPTHDLPTMDKKFYRVLRQWHDRAYDSNAPVSLAWWNWPRHYWVEARDGVRLGFTTKPPRRLMKNYASGECDEVLAELDRFEAAGFLEDGCVECINPIAYIPKKEAGKGRIIIDCLRSCVNIYLPSPPVVLPTVVDVLQHLYEGAWMCESDFKDHFYHYYVHEDDRPYLGVRRPHNGGTRRFNRLPMGIKTSPHHCTAMTTVLEDHLEASAPYTGVTVTNLPADEGYDPTRPYIYRRDTDGGLSATADVYVDDAIAIAKSRAESLDAIQAVVVRGGDWGFVSKYSKLKGPAQHGRAFNGFLLDTRPEHGGPKLDLRSEVRRDVLTLIDSALAHGRRIDRRLLARLVGKLMSLAPGVPHGVTFLRRLWDSLHGLGQLAADRPGRRYDCDVVMDSEHRKDLHWWRTALTVGDGTYLMRNRDVRLRVHYTDGSGYGTGGCGHEFTSKKLPKLEYFSGLWKQEVTSMTSNWKELRSILIALRKERVKADAAGLRSPLWRTRIYHLTDNLVSESILTKGTSTSPKLQQLLREIALEQQLQQCDLIPMHVAGKRLIYQGTDGLSRGQKNAGSLAGDALDVRSYNPLASAPAPISAPLRRWITERHGTLAELWQPQQWTAANIRGKTTLWMPPPLLAREAIRRFLRQRMVAPTTTAAVFLLPRRYTAPWRRLLRHFRTSSLPAGAGEHWPITEHEPLIVAYCPPWSPTQESTTKRDYTTRSQRRPTRTSASAAASTSNSTVLSVASTPSTASRPAAPIRRSRFHRAAASSASSATRWTRTTGRRY